MIITSILVWKEIKRNGWNPCVIPFLPKDPMSSAMHRIEELAKKWESGRLRRSIETHYRTRKEEWRTTNTSV